MFHFKIFKILNQPFSLKPGIKGKFKIIAGASLFVLLFYAVFQPFYMPFYELDVKVKVILSYGALCLGVLSFNFFILPAALPSLFHDQRWKAFHEMLWVIWNIFTVAASFFLFKIAGGFYDLTMANLLNGFMAMIAVSIIPVTAYVLISYNYLLKKNIQNARVLDEQLHKRTTKKGIDKKIILHSQRGNETLEINPDNFLYAEAAQNYVVFVLNENGRNIKKPLRMSFKFAEKQLKNTPNTIRCHRSFAVNINKIKKVKGNAQGFRLKLTGSDDEIPVSRKYMKDFKKYIGFD